MDNKKIVELMSDKAFMEALSSMETYQEVLKAFSEKGVELSEDELRQLFSVPKKIVNNELDEAAINKMKQVAETGELDEDMLEEVAGGDLVVAAAIAVGAAITFTTAYFNKEITSGVKKAWNWFTGLFD